ncbi:MAG: S41 family peptidase, partial [Fimbriimonadaceae bacterium]|nr:S41 family peptidase [Fimbriimonadaceae bacterium]
TPAQMRESLRKLVADGAKGLVFDLRGNPGGLLEAAAEMLGVFVEDQVVVEMRGRNAEVTRERTPSGRLMDLPTPVAILVNEDSASAAEIFAGVLRDYDKAFLVGEHTYGKASVQNVIPLRDRAGAKITTAKYFLPSGADISRKMDEDGVYVSGGLKPDIEVELEIVPDVRLGEPGRDSQLDRAIKELQARRP